MSQYWVFNFGTGEQPPVGDWFTRVEWRHHLSEAWFPASRRPVSVRAGDHGVLRAAGGGFVGVLVITSTEPETNDNAEHQARWPYKLRYRLVTAIPNDEYAPSLDTVGWVNPLSLRRQSHVRLDGPMYETIVRAILDAAGHAAGL